MNNRICSLLLLMFISGSLCAQSTFMRRQVQKASNQRMSVQQFAKSFPYGEYLKQIEFTDFRTLQADRYYLYRRMGDGDIFLYHLGDYFVRHYPVGIADLDTKIQIGEMYLKDKRNFGINHRSNEIYRIIGYFILGKVSHTLKTKLQQGKISDSSPQIQQAITRLADNKVYVSVEQGTLKKIIHNVQQGNFIYILDRIFLKIAGFMGTSFAFIWIALMGLAMLLFVFKKSRKFSLILVGVATLGACGIHFIQKSQRSSHAGSDGAITPLRAARYSLKPDKTYYRNGKGDPGMMVFDLRDANKRKIGSSIWMSRPNVRARYFAYQNVYQKYRGLQRNQRIGLATSGGFTNAQHQPEGLTVEDGNIVNAVIMPDRHGLVIVEKGGGIRVINLTRDKIKLPISSSRSREIDNPLHNLIAYSELLNWCRDHRATLFQTQLLAYGNHLLIDPSKSPSQMRERRILVGFRDQSNGKLHHAIFHVPDPHNLATLSEEIFMMIGNRSKKVEFMLNLDVGTYDILQVRDPQGRILRDVQGPKDIRTATNLIVWTF